MGLAWGWSECTRIPSLLNRTALPLFPRDATIKRPDADAGRVAASDLAALLEFPVQGGKVTVGGAGWKRVDFKRVFSEVPGIAVSTVAASSTGPARQYTPPPVDLRSVNVAATAVQKLTLVLAKAKVGITTPKVKLQLIDVTWQELYDRAKNALGDWGFAANWMRDFVASGIATVVYWVWYHLVKPEVDEIQKNIQDAITKFRNNIQFALDEDYLQALSFAENNRIRLETMLDIYRDSVNQRIGEFRGSVNDAFEEQRVQILEAFRVVTAFAQASFNDLLPAILTAIGVPAGARLLWVPVKGVSRDGFSFYAQAGGDYYWVAVSSESASSRGGLLERFRRGGGGGGGGVGSGG